MHKVLWYERQQWHHMTVEMSVSGAGDEDKREDKCDGSNDKLVWLYYSFHCILWYIYIWYRFIFKKGKMMQSYRGQLQFLRHHVEFGHCVFNIFTWKDNQYSHCHPRKSYEHFGFFVRTMWIKEYCFSCCFLFLTRWGLWVNLMINERQILALKVIPFLFPSLNNEDWYGLFLILLY